MTDDATRVARWRDLPAQIAFREALAAIFDDAPSLADRAGRNAARAFRQALADQMPARDAD